jgi:hypothetical protein
MVDRMARIAGPLVAELAKDLVLDLGERRAIVLGVVDRWWTWGTLVTAVALTVVYHVLGWSSRLRGGRTAVQSP